MHSYPANEAYLYFASFVTTVLYVASVAYTSERLRDQQHHTVYIPFHSDSSNLASGPRRKVWSIGVCNLPIISRQSRPHTLHFFICNTQYHHESTTAETEVFLPALSYLIQELMFALGVTFTGGFGNLFPITAASLHFTSLFAFFLGLVWFG